MTPIQKRRLKLIWSAKVKIIHRHKCELCGSSNNLHSHHIIPLSQGAAITYDLNNGSCLCIEHHSYAHLNQTEYQNMMMKKRGIDWWLELNIKKRMVVRLDYKQVLKELKYGENGTDKGVKKQFRKDK